MSDYSGELITLVDITQQFCSLTYGTAPCQAELGVTGDAKCLNTISTCQDTANYSPEDLTLRFAKQQEGLDDYGYVIPSVESVSITPLTINLGGMDTDMSPFGRRESVSIQFADHPHSDLIVDKYRLERPTGDAGTVYDPYETGSFWAKFLARNFYEGFDLKIHQGLVDDTVANMETRHYVIDRITGPSDGKVSLTAKDLFSKVERRKAKAPEASRGELREGFDENHSDTFEIIPAEIADTDYPTGDFRVAINDEAIKVNRSAGSATFAILERGVLDTTPEEHEGSDKVQRILEYVSMQSHDIIDDLLKTYTDIPDSAIPKSDWDNEMTDRPELLTGYLAEPTSVEDLVGELAEQIGFSIWPSVTDNEIKLKITEPPSSPSPTVDDDAWLIEGSYSSKRMVKQRASQVWIYYGQRNPLEDLEEHTNYHSRRIFADLESEGDNFYGTSSIREIFSRWIPQFGGTFAASAGRRILSLFRDPPIRAAFEIHRSREDELSLATPFVLESRDEQDELGQIKSITMAPIEIIRVQDKIQVLAQQLEYFTLPGETRDVTIESDTDEFNMRTAFQALYGDPNPGDDITVTVTSGITVGSTDPTVPSMTTGDWPGNVEITLVLESGAVIKGAGGDGGGSDGSNGQDGGVALEVKADLVINNNGTIAGAGGGGGGAHEELGTDVAQAQGGGGAGDDFGTGGNDGDATTGGDGIDVVISITGDDFIASIAALSGDGGDLGQAGEDGQVSYLGDTFTVGTGGKAGPAIDGSAYISFDNEGTITGNQISDIDTEITTASPTNLSLTTDVEKRSDDDYSTTVIFSFDPPSDDSEIVAYEVQYRLARHDDWQAIGDSLETRYEFRTAEIGKFVARVRSIYVRGLIQSDWAYTSVINKGTYDSIATLGLAAPQDPKLYITVDRDANRADVRVSVGYNQGATAAAEQFVLFYSVDDIPNQLDLGNDDGDKLYIGPVDIDGVINVTVSSGSTTTQINYTDSDNEVDIDLSGIYWVQVQSSSNGDTRFFKITQASSSSVFINSQDPLPFTPESGDNLRIIEVPFHDSRIPEFKFVYVDGEVIKHNGVDYDGSYYIDVDTRGAEGTIQADQSDKTVNYFPAFGPDTNIAPIPMEEFAENGGVLEYSGNIPIELPSEINWAAISCCFVRTGTDVDGARWVRSHIVPLTISGKA